MRLKFKVSELIFQEREAERDVIIRQSYTASVSSHMMKDKVISRAKYTKAQNKAQSVVKMLR
jgi:hypothetical protein